MDLVHITLNGHHTYPIINYNGPSIPHYNTIDIPIEIVSKDAITTLKDKWT